MQIGPPNEARARVMPVGSVRPAGLGDRAAAAADAADRFLMFRQELDRIRRPETLRSERSERSEGPDRPEGEAGEDPTSAGEPRPTGKVAERAPASEPSLPQGNSTPAPDDGGGSHGVSAEAPTPTAAPEPTATEQRTTQGQSPAASPTPPTPPAAPSPQAPSQGLPLGAALAPRGEAMAANTNSLTPSPARAQAPRAQPQVASPSAVPFEVVLEQFQAQLRPNLRQALVVLEPAELGRIAVRVRLEGGELRAVLSADSAKTQAVLERHLNELRAAFEAQGLEVAQLDVQLDGGGSRQRGEASAPRATADVAQAAPSDPAVSHHPRRSLHEGALDTYA